MYAGSMSRFDDVSAAYYNVQPTYTETEPVDILLRFARCLIEYIGGDWLYIERYSHTENGRVSYPVDRESKTPCAYQEDDGRGYAVCTLQTSLEAREGAHSTTMQFVFRANLKKRKGGVLVNGLGHNMLVKPGAVQWDNFLALNYAEVLQTAFDSSPRG
jgi:hypothetical protein